ncbi:MAG: excinuclease ABC subunit UvrA [Patescibacteria group bacterium]|nr:excinuclease ABC subunit UvrA [Patescibacteria group bacterium]
MKNSITIKGAREHNLKNIDLEIPRNKMVVFTGLSGSGKSSLAFDTIFAEGQRRYVESLSAYARQFLGQLKKPDVDEIEGLSPAISIDQKAHSSNPRSTVATITEIYDYLRVLYARIGEPHCPIGGEPIRKMTVDEIADVILQTTIDIHTKPDKIKSRKKASSNNEILILAPIVRGRKGEYFQLLQQAYEGGFSEVRVNSKIYPLRERVPLARYKRHNIELIVDRIPLAWPIENNQPLRTRLVEAIEIALDRADDTVIAVLDDGTEKIMSARFACPEHDFAFPEIEPRLFSFNSPYGACEACNGLGTTWIYSDEICETCKGARLRKEALNVLVNKKSIVDVTSLTIEAALEFFKSLKLNETELMISEPIMKEILSRLEFMHNVGLHYLTLNRIAGSLSGGEAQRIRLASQIGSGLVGALYVLDEPTIGLHQKDNARLVETLEKLRDSGNSIIVVEHDEDTIAAADYLVDFGPGAGKHGGHIVANGEMPQILQDKNSVTCAYLRGDKTIPVPTKRRTEAKKWLEIKKASAFNLKNINVKIPLKRFVAVTGVSGSGKSTLIIDILYRALAKNLYGAEATPAAHGSIKGLEWIDKIIDVDQSPIGRTPRSNPATYTGMWTPIRELYTMTPDARMRGYKPGRFSFNRPGGRCEHCEGNGQIAIEMHFLPTVYVPCDVCKGRRFNRETLEVKFRKKSIHDILKMNVEEANEFFKDIPPIRDRTKVLKDVGLSYIELGQPANTLSGGEAQRVKLSSELSKRDTGHTIYILDEPTTGLHFEDVKQLLEVLHKLVDRGNTVIVIEHNLDVIKQADWIIDLGPEGGDRGGTIVAEGTPEDVAVVAGSYTGQYLKRVLKR